MKVKPNLITYASAITGASQELMDRLRAIEGTENIRGNEGVLLGTRKISVDEKKYRARVKELSELISEYAAKLLLEAK